MAEDKPNSIDHDAATSDTPPQAPDDVKITPLTSAPVPETIGHYRIIRVIGEGGMGTVYLAEQTDPHRQVALKIIKLGMDTKQVIARFEAERQALAMMEHPGVAKVFDAGSSDTGRPYFVMEYVPGIAITDYCDRERLNTIERLDLFMQICEAVQHAHQKGIIHRDIKPGNILVSVKEGKAIPKVIDFGVAKATHQKLTEKTLFTEQGQLIGTPEYMSPEQAEMTGLDVDTRTDIYSLGVLLYELLTGSLPFEPSEFRQAAFDEIRRVIREEDPPKPSTRLSSLGDESGMIARQRRTDLRSLERQLRGDLDWITMKAMEKNRTRRYESAHGLAMDIRRHLDHQPVVAGPPGARYRMSKFIRRNRAGVLVASIVLIVLLTGIAGTTWGLLAASGARDAEREAKERTQAALTLAEQRLEDVRAARDAEAEQRRIAEEARIRAEEEADNAREISNFLTDDLLAAVAPSAESGKGKDVLMRDVLDAASEKIEEASQSGGRFADKPLIEASIRATLGDTYRLLGEYPNAEQHLERARELRLRELAEEHPSTLTSMNNLAILYDDQGRYDEAEPLNVKTLEIRKRVLGEEHPDTLNSMANLALLYWNQGRYDEAEPLNVKTLEIMTRVLGEEHPSTLNSMGGLANLYKDQGRYDEAEPLYVKILEIEKRILGEEHPSTLITMSNLTILYMNQGRYDEAEPLFVKTLEIQKRVLGEEHPSTLSSMNNLAILYYVQGRYDETEPLYIKTLEIRKRVLGEEHP
ncbi:MAG: serine/threonine protein kinase, partial [Phycisphaerales bacterium]|nr:serine/threonine protein kinase [Phycisphaerales bacterium]